MTRRQNTAAIIEQAEALRRFNRFYTRRIGVLREGLLQSPYSLTEARILFELAQRDGLTARDLCRDLDLDPGYASRILRRFATSGLLARKRGAKDARQQILALTGKGRAAFAPLNERSRREAVALLKPLSQQQRQQLVAATTTVARLLGDQAVAPSPIDLRPHRPGDMGWVIGAHGAIYAEEFGWDGSFEAMVADIAAKFIRDFDPAWERCWIAEMDGEPVGSVFIVRQSAKVAKLRMLVIDPKARGRNLGSRMVDACIRFSRAKGYSKIVLWTNSVLLAARSIYVKAGFKLVHSEKHKSFGKNLVGETWELKL